MWIDYQKLTLEVRKEILHICNRSSSGHVGSSFSLVEIITVLYNEIIRGNPDDVKRDRVVLSKGHALPALWATLRKKGWITEEIYKMYGMNGTRFGHHPHYEPQIGFDVNTGSLGHGLSIGAGWAFSAKNNSDDYRVYVILSDGDMNEGSSWEAATFASRNNLSNLCAIVDANQMQALGFTEDITGPQKMREKWEAFGWNCIEIDGHNCEQLKDAFSIAMQESSKPSVLIAHTIKGKGVSFMERNLLWHYRVPNGEELAAALKELEK